MYLCISLSIMNLFRHFFIYMHTFYPYNCIYYIYYLCVVICFKYVMYRKGCIHLVAFYTKKYSNKVYVVTIIFLYKFCILFI